MSHLLCCCSSLAVVVPLEQKHTSLQQAVPCTVVSNCPKPPKLSSLDVISRVFQQIHIISVTCHCIPFVFKICQSVADISRIRQLHEFFNLIFVGFFAIWPICEAVPWGGGASYTHAWRTQGQGGFRRILRGGGSLAAVVSSPRAPPPSMCAAAAVRCACGW